MILFIYLLKFDGRFGLVVLDLSVAPTLSEIDQLIQAASNILHQDRNNAMLLLLPQKYSGQTTKTCIMHQRRIEDALLANGISLETEIAMHFVVDAMHGNDKRPLSTRSKLCYSEKVVLQPEQSPWMLGQAARGKMADIPLLKVKEMKRLCPSGFVGEPVEAYNLSPAERTQQKGARAARCIVEGLIADTVVASPECRLDLIEVNLQVVPDWVEGAWNMRFNWSSDSSKPSIAYCGFCRDPVNCKTLVGHMESVLMSEFWENDPSAGPAEPADDGPIDKPALTLCTWEGASPVLPEVALTKFDGDDTYGGKWNGKVSMFREFVSTRLTPLVTKSVNPTSPEATTTKLEGPDFSGDGGPAAMPDVVLPSVNKDQFESGNVCLDLMAIISYIYIDVI